MVELAGERFALDSTHVGLACATFPEMQALAVLEQLPKLRSLSLGSSNINDSGLAIVAKLGGLAQLDLQETPVTAQGLAHLRALPKLSWLRLKECPALGPEATAVLSRFPALTELQLHGSGISSADLPPLAALKGLRDLLLDRHSVSIKAVEALSAQLPSCCILVKGHGECLGGRYRHFGGD